MNGVGIENVHTYNYLDIIVNENLIFDAFTDAKGANPQRVSTDIIIEIKQLYSGRMASNPFIASNHRYIVFPLRDTFTIENVLLFV